MSAESLLKQQLQSEMKTAMKARDKDRLGVIRLIMAAIKQREVDERIELDDEAVIAILDKMVKQRKESISQYRDGGREDLAEAEEAEMIVIREFLPQPLSDAEIDGLVREAMTESGASSIRDMGKVMAILKPKLQGRADMADVSLKLKSILNSA